MKTIYILSKDMRFINTIDALLDRVLYRVEALTSTQPTELYKYVCVHPADYVIIHHSYLGGYYRLIDLLISSKRCNVIYATPNMEVGAVYNVLSSPRFYMIDPERITSLPEVINIMDRDIKLIENLEESLDKVKEKIDEERMVKRAKLYLMKENKWDEETAYKYILKKAMDERSSKLLAAKSILQRG